MKNAKNYLPVVLFILAAVLLISGGGLYLYMNRAAVPDLSSSAEETEVSAETESVMEETESVSPSEDGEISASSETEEPVEEEEPEPEIIYEDNPYKDYFLQNSDMIGWLNIPDTIVDYPVMWTPEDETYYLHRGFDKVKRRGGCLILDTDSSVDPYTTNLIIHGHNNKNQMFGDLSLYEDEAYRDENPYIYFTTAKEEKKYEVIACFRSQVYYTTDTCFKYYNFFNAETEEEFDDFYKNIMALSYYESDSLNASFGDRFMTLSTCSYHVDNGRFVVVAKEIETTKYFKPFTEEEVLNEEGN